VNQNSIAQARAERSLQKMQYMRQTAQESGGGGADLSSAGPPSWNRSAWEAFKATYGFYPFGPQGDGGVVRPPTMAGAPDWVYELMGERRPPITVMPT
jgi:hypothetical protein